MREWIIRRGSGAAGASNEIRRNRFADRYSQHVVHKRDMKYYQTNMICLRIKTI